jgi:AcrR family transcriptional regulator
MGKIADDTRTTILKGALQLFLIDGYKDVSYRDLMKKTGLSKGAIYHHFASKKDILDGVFEFFLNPARQPLIENPKNQVTDIKSFRKVFTGAKMEQFRALKKIAGVKTIKINKLLFFVEAINENDKLKGIVNELLETELKFIENCFGGLKKHNKLPRGKDPALLAESLYLMIEGAEQSIFFLRNYEKDEDFIKAYDKIITDYFNIIS